MKKITVLACALAFSLGFVGCSSDDEGSSVSAAKLEGRWAHETYKVTAAGQTVVPEEAYDDNQAGCAKDYLQFNADNTAVYGDYYSTDCDLDTDTTSWSLDGKTVTIMEDGVNVEYKIIRLTATEMTAQTSEDLGGVTWKDTYTFSKVN